MNRAGAATGPSPGAPWRPRGHHDNRKERTIGELVELCRVSDLEPGEGTTVHAGDRDVAVFNVDGEFYALDNACTHEGGPLGQGMLFGSTVSCPWHFAEFDVTTGESLDSIAPCDVGTYQVTVEDGVVKAELG